MKKDILTFIDSSGDENKVAVTLNMYAENENLAVRLEEYDAEYDYWDSYCSLTVNVSPLPFLESALDLTYSGQEKIDFLVKNGFGELTGGSLCSGMCVYPVFRFNEEKLRELDPEAFEQYAKAHGREPARESLETQMEDAAKKVKDFTDKGAQPREDKYR